MPCAFQFFLSEKFDFCTHVLYRIFEGVLCDMRINIQSCTDLGMSHMDLCDKEKVELVPEDGWLLKPVEVSFKQGQSVFDVLQQVCRDNKIHMEFSMTPIYNSAYIEGIGNLYEFDCGEVSGWMYKVNDWFPNYGCSRYQLQNGDVVEWEYTCELGKDIGGGYATGSTE